ncbi:hypothetical protein ACFC08_28650 [Streptomyces sp. NPDC056112]|uniref:hypothetical protein n=1 Tax=Streptomyces sp. NPDC056112 TaxID=3345715 RepID=UPI0035DE2949
MTETTELDPTRRYLRPVARLPLPDQPDVVHLAVYEWLPMFEAWATGMALCGYSTRQGPLPEGTVVTCARCLEWQPKCERMLAPGYRPEDDDPDVLRRRAEAAERLHQTHLEVERRLAVEGLAAAAAIERVRNVLDELKAQGATGMQFYTGVLAALDEPKRRTR